MAHLPVFVELVTIAKTPAASAECFRVGSLKVLTQELLKLRNLIFAAQVLRFQLDFSFLHVLGKQI